MNVELVGVLVDGKPVLVQKRLVKWSLDRRGSKSRCYVDGDAAQPTLELPAFTVRGEDAEVDRAWKRYNREEVRLLKAVVNAVGVRGGFSRTAGCSCGCSPGVLVESGVSGRNDLYLRAELLSLA